MSLFLAERNAGSWPCSAAASIALQIYRNFPNGSREKVYSLAKFNTFNLDPQKMPLLSVPMTRTAIASGITFANHGPSVARAKSCARPDRSRLAFLIEIVETIDIEIIEIIGRRDY